MGITSKQLAQIQRRLAGEGQAPAAPQALPPANAAQTILGIDPSLRAAGYGVIRGSKSRFDALAQGTIRCPRDWERTRCLAHIAATLRQIVRDHKPAVCVAEGLFFAQNIKTAIIMGEARGAALAVIAEAGLQVFEISPRKAKQAIVGYGAAQKSAVAKMVQRMLNLKDEPEPDAADALALALAFSQEQSRYRLETPKPI